MAALCLGVQHYMLNPLHTPRARLHSLRTALGLPSRARPTPNTVFSAYCRRLRRRPVRPRYGHVWWVVTGLGRAVAVVAVLL